MATTATRKGQTKKRSQQERSAATIDELVRAARKLFVKHGYHDTSLEDVVEAVGMTKGAVYHHFKGKQDLFRAVYEREQQTLVDVCVAASRRQRDFKGRIFESCRAFFDASLDPGVQRITLIDAPAALGWEGMREIEYRYTVALIITGLELAMDEGAMPRRPVLPLAHLIFGATCEGVMLVARSENQRAMSRRVLGELKIIIDAFF